MSLTTIVTVHCDTCSTWEYTADPTTRESTIRDRKRVGWRTHIERETGRRVDSCPRCLCPLCLAGDDKAGCSGSSATDETGDADA